MKTFYLIVLIAFTSILIGQETKVQPTNSKRNEFKIGTIKLFVPMIEGSYERILSKKFSIGTSVLLTLNKNSKYYEDFSITTFGRFYVQKNQPLEGNGLFVEFFGKYISGRYPDYVSNNDYNVSYKTVSIGVGVGKKWVTDSGFVIEPMAGFGQNISTPVDAPKTSFRGDIFIGYRF